MKKIFTFVAATATCIALSTAVMAADAMKSVDSALDKTSTALDKADKKEADLKEKAAKKDAAMKEKAAKKDEEAKARQKKIDDQTARINKKKNAVVKDATDINTGLQDLKK